jgi:serine/threonine protein kinase/tetratricopeptide (TPR) repeat protein
MSTPSDRRDENEIVTVTLDGAAGVKAATSSTIDDRPGDRPSRGPAGAELATGTVVGRYVLVARLGAGGMGVVYAAYDPELDRRIAIKLIHAAGDKKPQREARERLLREAQALAQLSHPNVVAVHDVGMYDGNVFIAMELVRGSTLRSLIKATARIPAVECRRIMIDAGEGLAAAHRAGLVHRDVKPSNILVAYDGNVRVADFGLARAASDPEPAHVSTESENSGPRADGRLRSPLTAYGSMVGTPSYMAPELFAGGSATPLSDQFSYCVTAFEAFYGTRPFTASSLPALRDEIQRGEPRIPDGVRVPARVRAVLLRGLAKDPAARYPTMDALLDDLGASPAVTPARIAIVASSVIAIAAMGWAMSSGNGTEPCSAARDDLAGVWNGPRRASIHVAFAASGAAYATTTSKRVDTVLDEYASAWTDMRVESCRATRVSGTQSEHLLDLRTACLDRLRLQLAALVDVFVSDADEAMVRKAVSAAAALPPIAACGDVEALTAAVPPPDHPHVAAAVASLRARLDYASALVKAGRYDQARQLAIPIATEADRLDYQATRGEVRRVLGEARLRAGDLKGAEVDLHEAIRAAARARNDRLAGEAWALLIYTLGQQARHQEALVIRTAAEAAVDRAGGDPILHATVLGNIGGILNQLERFTDSEKVFADAIAVRERSGAREQPELASILSGMGNSLNEQGRHREARTYYERAIAVWERTLGSDHPQIAIPFNNLGNSLADQGEHAEAERFYRRAISVWERALGPSYPNLAYPHNGLGSLLNDQGRHDDAWPHFERAYVLWREQLGDDHPDVGMALNNLGQVRLGQKRYDEALDYLQRALAIDERALGKDHPSVAHPLTGIGDCQLARGRTAEALAALERAWKIRSSGSTAPLELATTQFALARAVHAAGDRRRARQLATEALKRLGDTAVWASSRTEIEAWLKTH